MRTLLPVIAVLLAGCGKSPQCGAGTVEVNGQCVAQCGPGTVLDAGQCVVSPSVPKAGNPCSTAGFVCQDGATALECISSSWVGLPCRGPKGCVNASGTVSCDMNGDLEGDRCASSAEGRALCAPGGKATLECRSGVLVKTNTCSSCTVMNDLVVCTP